MRNYKNRFISSGFLVLIILLSASVFFPINNSSFEPISEGQDALNLSDDELVIITPENKTYTRPMSGYYPAVYGFEDEIVGTTGTNIGFVDSWNGAPTSASIESEIGGHKNILREEYSGGTNGDIFHYFDTNHISGQYEFWFRSENPIAISQFLFMEGGVPGPHPQLKNGYFTYHDGIDHNLIPCNADQWYHLAFEWYSNNTFDWYINDAKILDGGSYLNDLTNGPDRIRLTAYAITTNYYDAFGNSWDNAYEIGDNIHKGLLLSYDESITFDWVGYSLDNMPNKTIFGNFTISMPYDDTHSIQLFGNNSLGDMFQSEKRFFTIHYNPIDIITPENITYTAPMSGYYPATYGFEDVEQGAFPEDWHGLNVAGSNYQILDHFNEHRKVIEMSDQSDNWGLINTNFATSVAISTVEFWYYPDTEMYSTFNLMSDISQNFLYMQFVQDVDLIRYYDGAYHNFYYNYIEKWYHIRIEIDYLNANYDIYIDGNMYVEDGLFNHPADKCANITFQTWGSGPGSTGFVYIDAIGLSSDENYKIGDNFHEGLLLGYETNKDFDWMGYSLDNKANITIMGNEAITMPRNGSHTIQVFGNDSLGDMFQSEKRYFTMHYNSVDIITPENITYIAPMDGYFPGTYGFENDLDGEIPEGWVNTTGTGYTIEVIEEKYDHKKVVELSDNTGTNNPIFMKYFTPYQTTGTIEFWLATTNAEKGTVLSFQDLSLHVAFQVEIDDDKIKFLYQGHQYLEYIMENDQWRHVRIDFNCITDKVTFWLDQNQLGPALNFYTAIDYIGKFFISTNYGDSAYSSYIDTFGYSWDPYYRVGDNNNEGILFNYDDLPDFAWREFSLDSQPRQPILGHKTLPVPEDGMHSIQFFAQDSLGDYYESEMRFFTIEIAPSVEWVSPGDGSTVILPYTKAPYANDGLFTFQYTYRLLDDIELEIDGTNLGSVFNKTSIVLTPYTDYTNGFLSATLIGINNSVIVDSDTRNFQFVKITHEVTQILNSSTQIIGKQLYLILHDPHGDNSFSSISESTTLSIGVGSQITNALGVSVEVGAEFSLFGFTAGASVLLEAKQTLTQGYDFRYEIKETTSLTSSQVTDDADYIGSGYGDRYWGESWIYKWVLNATYREYSNDTMNGWENPKLYYGILRGVETFASDEHAPAEWKNQNAAYNDTIPVSWITPFQESGGAPYIFENEVSTTTRRTTSFQIDLGADFELKFGALETHATIELSVKNYAEIEVGNVHKVAYHIEDDDPSDFLVQWIGIDERFGTYIFESDPFLCETSHPLEHNTYDYLPPEIDFPTITLDTNNDNTGPADDDSPLVRVNIFEEGGLQDVVINYSIDNGVSWSLISLDEILASPGLWEGAIPSFAQDTKVKWYIIAWDSQGNRAERKDIYGNPFEYTVVAKPFVPSYPPILIVISLMIPVAALLLRNRKKLHKIKS
ncbi:MAG: hypothetical protein ACTSP9_04350 [Promethearchaeota archaeon]